MNRLATASGQLGRSSAARRSKIRDSLTGMLEPTPEQDDNPDCMTAAGGERRGG
jgi:hypothetical protein